MMNKNQVLLIGPNFHYFLQSMQNAFCKLGWEVCVCAYDNPIHPYNTINKIRYKLTRDKFALKELSKTNYRQYVESTFDALNPQLVLIINGDNLLPKTVEYFATKSKVAIWLFDSITRIEDTLPNIPYAHAIFCYEKEDIQLIKTKYNIDANFVAQAVDDSLYFHIPKDKTLDIVFAGDIFHSTKRREIIPKIVKRYAHKSICIWGLYKPYYKGLWTWLTREQKQVYKNRNTTAQQLNNAYNHSRVVLNIHHEQQKNGANPKVFEIAATGSYQICDANPYIEELFPNGEIGIYHDEQELFELIDYALAHDMSAQTEKARQTVINNHTFKNRVQQMLDLLYN